MQYDNLPFTKSEYDVLAREFCEKVKRNSKSSKILEMIDSFKICLCIDVVKNSDCKGKECLDFLQRNRHIIRMTINEFYSLVPFPERYSAKIEKANGKRIVVSSKIWSAKIDALISNDYSKFQETIDTVRNNHLYDYFLDSNGFMDRKKSELF
jgi:hypothetical protein